MKNTLKFYAIAVMLVLVVVSCKKKTVETDIASLPYASETVFQGKTNLSTAGTQTISELNTLADANGIGASNSMTYFLDQALPFAPSSQSAIAFSAVKTAGDYTSKNPQGILQFLSANLQSEQDSTFQEIFNKRKGIYTWNKTTKKWDKTTSTDKIELLFPSTKDGSTNDAKFDLTYTSKTIAPTSTNSTGELPLSLDGILYVGADKVLEYSFTAQWDNSGIPTNISTFLALYPFKFETTLTNNSSAASVRYLFTDNTKTIFDFYAGINGNFSQTNINNSQDPTDVLTNANAYFQVFNIKLAGRIDVKGLAQKEKEVPVNATDEQYTQAEVDACNQYIALVLMYADSNQKIAQAEFYSLKTVVWGYPYYSNEMRFVFTDGTKGDLKTYFGNGFKDLITDFNTLIVKLNTKYSLGAKPITYTGN